jgi:tetratricopeptide (TPR) repeat protein
MGAREILQSWKEISAYLGRDIRTCRRWEENLGLPIHRLDGSPKARVLAYKDEIDSWLDWKLHEREVEAPPAVRLPSFFALLRRWYVLAAFTAVLVIGVLGWRTISNGRPGFVPTGSRPALAVLPFVNDTGDEGLDYLRESLPDHLVRDLQRSAEHLRVFRFDIVAEAVRKLGLEPGVPLTPDDLAAVSARTGAGWLLIGHLSRAGTKIRVDYEVRAPQAGKALRTTRLPGTEADIGVLEARIANGVRRAFGVPISAGSDMLQGCSILATRFYETARAIQRKYPLALAPDDLDKMIGLFNKAREADPGCPLAYLGLGDAFQNRFVYEGRDPESLRLMNENYRRAYEMAPERADTNVGVGWIHYFRRDNDQAYAFFRKAMELDPSSLHVLTEVGAFLRSIGVLERSTEYFSKVIKAGGPNADILMLRAWTYEQMGLYESALADLDELAALDPADFMTRCIRARVLVLMRRYEAAAAELAMADGLAPGERYVGAVRALLAAARGDRKTALEGIAAAREPDRPVRYTYFRSRIYAVLGLKDQAVGDIELAIERGFDDVYDYLYCFPFLNNTRDYFYDELRGDPRFTEILRRQERTYVAHLEQYSGL